MSEAMRVNMPLDRAEAKRFRAGDRVLLNGKMLTGRDAAHKRLWELAADGKDLPISI